MAEQTGIEWTDHTFNPWWGCEKVSPGCAHCYADTLARRYEGPGLWGTDHRFRFFGDAHWAEPRKWNRKAQRAGERARVFCASMADVFEDRPELVEHRRRLIELVYETPCLDWQLLTKRPENVARMLGPNGVGLYAIEGVVPCPQPNIWIGTSIENARFTWRADELRAAPAAVRFISAEPLLGSLYDGSHDDQSGTARAEAAYPSAAEDDAGDSELAPVGRAGSPPVSSPGCSARAPLDLTDVDWVIAGGESGPGARPMNPAWARELRDACIAACPDCAAHDGRYALADHDGCERRPAFLFKQWGEWAPYTWAVGDNSARLNLHGFEDAGRITYVRRFGKKTAGRELDGRTWDEFPRSREAVPA